MADIRDGQFADRPIELRLCECHGQAFAWQASAASRQEQRHGRDSRQRRRGVLQDVERRKASVALESLAERRQHWASKNLDAVGLYLRSDLCRTTARVKDARTRIDHAPSWLDRERWKENESDRSAAGRRSPRRIEVLWRDPGLGSGRVSPCPGLGARGRGTQRGGQVDSHAHSGRRRSPGRGRDAGRRRARFICEIPADALSRGISMVHQELSVLPDLTVAENLLLGREPMWLSTVLRRRDLQRASLGVAQPRRSHGAA